MIVKTQYASTFSFSLSKSGNILRNLPTCHTGFVFKTIQKFDPPMYGFIAQLVEHRTGIAEVTGSNPVEALIFFQASSFQLL